MCRTQDLWSAACESLKNHEPFVLLVVVDNTQRSPGKQGFKMLCNAKGCRVGSVGGGAMESYLIERALCLLENNERKPVLIQQVHSKEGSPTHRSGLVCGGSQQIVCCPFYDRHYEDVCRVYDAVRTNTPCEMHLTPEGARFSFHSIVEKRFTYQKKSAEEWSYRERVQSQGRLYVIGSGHVGLALCRMMRYLDFYVTAFDSRSDVHTVKENEDADRLVITSYDQLSEFVEEGEESYVAVLSNHYEADVQALWNLLPLNLRYLGVMGSPSKISFLKKSLLANGRTEEQWKRVRTPIGLPIGSRSAEEIAISIVAEILEEKNKPYSLLEEKEEERSASRARST